jgi:hypothetical protein
MKAGLWSCVRAAFNAKPLGMPIAPNWIGLAAFGFLGFINPGFWLLGAGLEMGYLLMLASNRRFQNLVAGSESAVDRKQWEQKLKAQLAAVGWEGKEKYQALEQRCHAILDQQAGSDTSVDLAGQREGLGKLLWIYLRLLGTRENIQKLLREAAPGPREQSLDQRLAGLDLKLKDAGLTEDLRKSLTGQREILQQRLQGQHEARDNLAYIEAELLRIQEQVELIREQVVLASDPAVVSNRIDQIGATLGTTNQWIRDRQQLYGSVEDLLDQPPPLLQAN